MALTIELPQVGESLTEGVIQKWLKKPGDRVAKYDLLVEVVTDKVTMEVPSPVSGVLVRFLAQEGQTLPMGAPLCEIETQEAPAPVASTVTAPGITGTLVESSVPMGPTGVRVEEQPVTPEERTRYSPVVGRLAAEHGLALEELASIKGSGAGGRVTKDDVLRYLEMRKALPAPVVPAPPGVAAPPARPVPEAAPDEEVLPLTPVRRLIAEHVTRAAQIPTAWTAIEVDVTSVVKLRESLKEEFQRREGVELTYLPFVVKAVVESLKEHPKLNSSWGGDRIILKRHINIGIAVAAPQGLVVPVVKDADHRSTAGLAKAIRDLTLRARENKLTLQDVQGSTFTVNNTGTLGSIVSQPIINEPDAAVLTTEAIVKRPVVIDDAIAIRSMMNLCITFDHRILDGHEVSAFLQSVKRRLEAVGSATPIY